jgi:hydroxyacylglutathione hydrolase
MACRLLSTSLCTLLRRLVCNLAFLFAAQQSPALEAWNARGLGPLPRQGISTFDLSDDGSHVAVGTISAPGDPNVFLLDARNGQLLGEWEAGVRWVEKVIAGPEGVVYALVTMSNGTAEDFPKIYVCKKGEPPKEVPVSSGQGEYPRSVFHWGDASNHIGGVQLCGTRKGAALVIADQVLWIEGANPAPVARAHLPRPQNSVTVSAAANAAGWIAIGCASWAGEANLFLFEPHGTKPVWTRIPTDGPPMGEKPAPGLYGSPTLRNGNKQALPQRDQSMWAPLSIVLFGEGKPERIAVADYQGWQRWVKSMATLRQQNYGLHFRPSAPTISVYDGAGTQLKRMTGAEILSTGWVDMDFNPDGSRLIAAPHTWTARGLAGRARLPLEPHTRFDVPPEVLTIVTSEPPALVQEPSLNAEGCVLRFTDSDGRENWKVDLEVVATKGEKPWVARANASEIVEGLWRVGGGRYHSDMGGQRLIAAPDGLILLEAHAGLSFEAEWAAIASLGLDPMNVKYVLATHEHGDHSPGAYLWRVVTGARFVCSAEMAYHLQHHLPLGTGYGFHPPNFTDLVIKEDRDLNLAGLKVRAVRLPGHTAGSMGWLFEKAGQRYLSTGDLIMGKGTLGYAGSVNFSAPDVLASLRKIRDLAPDALLPGHGSAGDPAPYLAGIRVGESTGWARMKAAKPIPFFNIKAPEQYRVIGWNQGAVSGKVADFNVDKRPDVARYLST